MIKKITDKLIYIGANDHNIDLFEGQYVVPNGMAYNSYVILDEKTVVMDTIDKSKTEEWLENIDLALANKEPDYLVVQHMEPDHAASIQAFAEKYKKTTVVANAKTFQMIKQFFPTLTLKHTLEVKNGEQLELGEHTLNFVFAPMVHWPEVMMTYESTEKILFAADGFGKFGANDVDEPWDDEARRYYIGIVGKYGKQVQNILQKAVALDIEKICPLHGPILEDNLGHYINLYDIWSSYTAESDGVVIAYTSVYGHTKNAVKMLEEELIKAGVPKVIIHDLARDDMAKAVEDAFRYDKLVLATTTYNAEIFPFMKHFIDNLTERNYQNRTIGFIENGSWSPVANKIMKGHFTNSKNITYLDNDITIMSAMNDENVEQIKAMATELSEGYTPLDEHAKETFDPTALFKIGYGLYVVTSNDGKKDNGLIVNTVTQISDNPNRIAVNINKNNYSCEVIEKAGKLNVCVISEDAPFNMFKHYGFVSGRDVDKFEDVEHVAKAKNDLMFLTKYSNAYISCKVFDTVDLGTHIMFLCDVTESIVLSDKNTMTYTYYQENVKPKPDIEKGYICEVCGFVYEGSKLPDDYICPLCKHGVDVFSKIG